MVKNGDKNIFAVVDDNKKLKGILTLDDIRPYLFNKEMDASQLVIQIMKTPPAILHRDNKPLDILQTFDDTGVWNLPVVSENNDFIGFISKSSILMSYRQLLKEYSD
jgi:CIC family chloride channel protein